MAIIITEDIKTIWRSMVRLCNDNMFAAAGILGNLYAESGVKPNNLQNSFEARLNMSDQQYTSAVDSGKYTEFCTDKAGYGLAQWTIKTRKQNLLAVARAMEKSVGSLELQIYYLCMELRNYSVLYKKLCEAASVREAAEAFLMMYEKPSNITQEKKDRRTQFGETYYEQLKLVYPEEVEICSPSYTVLKRYMKGDNVKQLQENLMELGYSLPDPGADGSYGRGTANAVKEFQHSVGLVEDGIAGAFTQDLIINELMKRRKKMEDEKSYTVTISHLNSDEAQALFEAYQGYPVTLEEE